MLKKTTLVATAMIPLGGGGGKNVVSAANTKKKGRMLTTTHFWAGKETTPTGFMESSFDCTQSCANSFDPSQAELAGKYCVECCSRTGGFHKNPCTKSSKDSQALQNRRKEYGTLKRYTLNCSYMNFSWCKIGTNIDMNMINLLRMTSARRARQKYIIIYCSKPVMQKGQPLPSPLHFCYSCITLQIRVTVESVTFEKAIRRSVTRTVYRHGFEMRRIKIKWTGAPVVAECPTTPCRTAPHSSTMRKQRRPQSTWRRHCGVDRREFRRYR
ncbi:unnamed protein product [Amoebophrya sp. A120]|nr:unnamed protein product [Amoebophrya sp. A120]|eukprot:GSA120T00008630001.1